MGVLHLARRFRRSSVLVAAAALLPLALLLVPGSARPVASVAAPSSVSESASASSHEVKPTVAAYVPDAPTLGRRGWTASASDATTGHPATSVLDANAFTYWESPLPSPSNGNGASITLELPSPQVVSGIIYEPRQGASPVGAIGQFNVSVSSDGVHFTTTSMGTWADTTGVKEVGIAAVSTRFVRLTALTNASGSRADIAAAELYLLGTPHVSANLTASVSSGSATTPAVSTNPAVVGQWGPVIGFPLVPVAAALLPHNELLVWSADGDVSFGASGANYTQTAILNLTTGAVSALEVSNTNHNMFCPGVAILANGDIMVTGGLSDQQTSIYSPATNTWSAGPQMNIGRGYQAMTLLSNGQAFTLGGSWSGGLGGKLGEIWSPNGGWRELTGVPATPMYTQDAQGVYRADNHGWFIATSGGNVLQAGPSQQMNWITTTGAGSITPAGDRGTSADAMNGNAVYYDIDKVITMGGAPDYQDSDATNAAYELTLGGTASAPTVTTTQVGSMNYPRAFANSVVLPNGEVVTMGGQTYAVPFSDADSELNPELWNPATGQFTLMAPEAEPRNYHSVAVLLPNGTVFSGGGGLCGSCSTNHLDGQIWTPPYLLNANGTLRVRPSITSAPTTAATGATISVTTAQPVASFSMVRYGESTHSVDNDQRRIPLSIVSSSGDTYQLAIPSDPGIALPGPYMLFAIGNAGTPSVSTTISITNVASKAPLNSYGKAVYNSGPSMYWPLNDTSGPTAADVSGNGSTGNYSTTGITYQAHSPAEGVYYNGVTLNGSSGQIVASQPITNPTTYSEEMWFKTSTKAGGDLMGFGDAASGFSDARDRLVWMSNDGQLNFGIYTGQTVVVQSPNSYNDGKWHYVVATQGADGINLYVDGKLVANNAASGAAQAYLGYWRVGGENLVGWPNSSTSNYFSGVVSDAAFYNSELSASQVQAHYTASPGS